MAGTEKSCRCAVEVRVGGSWAKEEGNDVNFLILFFVIFYCFTCDISVNGRNH